MSLNDPAFPLMEITFAEMERLWERESRKFPASQQEFIEAPVFAWTMILGHLDRDLHLKGGERLMERIEEPATCWSVSSVTNRFQNNWRQWTIYSEIWLYYFKKKCIFYLRETWLLIDRDKIVSKVYSRVKVFRCSLKTVASKTIRLYLVKNSRHENRNKTSSECRFCN